MSKINIFNKETSEFIISVNTSLQAFRYRYNLLSKEGIDTVIQKEKKKKKTIHGIKIKDKKEFKRDAWNWFSKYIRLKDADENGFSKCVTCDKIAYWEGGELQAGHFIDGRNNSVLLNENIVHVQCVRCNVTLSGNKNKYNEFMKQQGHSDNDLIMFENLKNIICKKGIREWEWESKRYEKMARYEAQIRNITI